MSNTRPLQKLPNSKKDSAWKIDSVNYYSEICTFPNQYIWNLYKAANGDLDYLEYNRAEAEEMLIKSYGFQSTGGKHEENIFTKWFQNFYLPKKFGIDKRKAFYSSLINANQMTRKEAIDKLAIPPTYPLLEIEKTAMSYPKHDHSDYKQDKWFDRISKVIKICRKIGSAVGLRP